MAKKKFDKWSEGCFKDLEQAKYDEYISCGGSGSWSSWSECQSNYLLWKSLANSDEEFRGLAQENATFMSNVSAYMQASDLYNNNEKTGINSYWIKDSEKFPFKRVPASPSDKLTDYPNIYVEPYDQATSLVFGTSEERPYNILESDGETRREGIYDSANNIAIQREIVNIGGITYTYTGNETKFPGTTFTNDITGEKSEDCVPEKCYYSKSSRRFFLNADFDKRIILPVVQYETIPNKVSLPISFDQYSIWYDRASADVSLEKAKEEYYGEYKRAVVDSIPYDPWQRMLDDLMKVYGKFVILGDDEQRNDRTPPLWRRGYIRDSNLLKIRGSA